MKNKKHTKNEVKHVLDIDFQKIYTEVMVTLCEKDREIERLKMRNETEIEKNRSIQETIDKTYDEIIEIKQNHKEKIQQYQLMMFQLLQMFIEDGDY